MDKKTKKITNLPTGISTIVDSDGQIHVVKTSKLKKNKNSWIQSIKFFLTLTIIGSIALGLVHIFKL